MWLLIMGSTINTSQKTETILSADFNHDGQVDEVHLTAGVCPPGVICEDNFTLHPTLYTQDGRPFELAPVVFEPGSVFGKYTFALTRPDIRVYQEDGLLSVARGQRVGFVRDGLFCTMTIDGLVMGLTRHTQDGKFVQAENRGQTWMAYAGKGRDVQKSGLDSLVWLTAKGQPIDPNKIAKKLPDVLNSAEALLKPLFTQAAGLGKSADAKATIGKIDRLLAHWKNKAIKENPTLTREIISDKALMVGIRHALGKLAGLSAADFKSR